MRLRELGSVRGFKVANRADQRGHCTLPFSNIVMKEIWNNKKEIRLFGNSNTNVTWATNWV